MSDTNTYVVCIEWPSGYENVEFEMSADATDEQINETAKDEFFNRCNFGWYRKGE